MHNAQLIPIKRTAALRVAALPPAMPPIRVALLSDIHAGNRGMLPARLADIVRRVNAQQPDVILLAGDFIIGESPDGAAQNVAELASLSDLRARWGVFAVLGNHDHWTAPDAMRRQLAKAGIVVLENAAVRRGPLAIVGIGDRFSGHDNIAQATAQADILGGIPVVVTHSPDIAPELPVRFPILLAGHTHCGQMVLPWVGPIVRYSHWKRLYDPKYQCGRVDDGGRTTIVTGGVGSGAVPVRINAMTDWWLITLDN
jgi:uncharacterized protein